MDAIPDYTLSAKITGDASGFEKSVKTAQKAVNDFDKKVSDSVKAVSQQTGKNLNQIAAETGKTINQIRSEVMKAASEYQKSGMSQSEAIKKAYADIGYSAENTANKQKKTMVDAYESIEISADKSAKEQQKSLSRISQAAEAVAEKFDKIGKKITSIGNSLTKNITKPAMIATSAIAGITLVKGWNRLTAIDDAKAKLQGLGHSAETVEVIMDSALESVKGTSYGLDEAATTAANAVAAGIKPGKDLTKYLTMTADAAAIAGTSMSEMGSIINKVQTGQTVYTEELEQFADRGLPVYQWLAEEAGVAASEVKKLASTGQISSEMLFRAIEKNIGGAAKTIGETSFSAALANMGASLSRIGANFLDAGGKGGGFFSQLKPLISDLTGRLEILETKAAELGVKFGEAFANVIQKVQEIKAKFDSLPPSVQNLILKVSGIGVAAAVGIGPMLKVVGSLTSGLGSVIGVIGGMSGPILAIVAAIAALAAAFGYLMNTNDEFRTSIMSTFSELGASLAPVLESLGQTFSELGSSIMSSVGEALQELAPVFAQMIQLVAELIATIAPLIAQLVSALAPIIAQIVDLALNIVTMVLPVLADIMAQMMPVIQQIVTLVAELFTALAPLISQLVDSLAPVIMEIVSVLTEILSALMPPLISIIEAVMSVIEAILPPIMQVLTVVVDVISGIMEVVAPIVSFIGQIIAKIVEVISPIIQFIAGVISKIVSFVSPLISKFSEIFGAIYDVVSGIMGNIGNFFGGIIEGIQNAWNGLVGFVSGIFDGIASAFNSLVDGVKSVINGVIWAINGAIWVINLIPGVEIGEIPYLAHGTDDWQGGFAYMNEGGRGELTYLPNGAQVIPHDISVKYAKESARANASAEPVDISGVLDGMIIQIVNNTNVDGTPLKETVSDYTIRKIGNQQKAVLRSRGAYA